MMEALLRQVLFGGSETRLLTLRVCRRVFPWVEPDNVDEKLRCVCVLLFESRIISWKAVMCNQEFLLLL